MNEPSFCTKLKVCFEIRAIQKSCSKLHSLAVEPSEQNKKVGHTQRWRIIRYNTLKALKLHCDSQCFALKDQTLKKLQK